MMHFDANVDTYIEAQPTEWQLHPLPATGAGRMGHRFEPALGYLRQRCAAMLNGEPVVLSTFD